MPLPGSFLGQRTFWWQIAGLYRPGALPFKVVGEMGGVSTPIEAWQSGIHEQNIYILLHCSTLSHTFMQSYCMAKHHIFCLIKCKTKILWIKVVSQTTLSMVWHARLKPRCPKRTYKGFPTLLQKCEIVKDSVCIRNINTRQWAWWFSRAINLV